MALLSVTLLSEGVGAVGFELGTDGPSAILVGVDGSDTSMRAAAYAAGLARRQHAKLVVVYVRSLPGGLLSLDQTGLAPVQAVESADETETQLRETITTLAAARGVDASLVVRWGDPLHVVADLAAKLKVDAVIVGASARLGHRIAGALGVRLARARRWPVTVVP
jgi:nucleotide-binding universal stress UspA family protein